MKNLYCISGLGADQRIFQKLDIPGVQLVPVAWPAFDRHDDMACYAQKVLAQIKEEKPMLLGVSFGGMLSVEIAKQAPVQKVIIVSSAKTIDELPPVSAFARFMVHNNLIPVGLFKHFHKQMAERFGATTEEEKNLLVSILHDTDNAFVKWAGHAMINWKNHQVPQGLVHIHGTADRLIPPTHIHPDYWVEGGSHFMIYNRAAVVSRIIASELKE